MKKPGPPIPPETPPPETPPLTPARQRRRRAIAEAARAILEREGYARLTARKVAEEAGMSLGHITYGFDGMDEVLAEAYRLASQKLRAATEADIASAPGAPMARLEAFLRAGFDDEFLDPAHLRLRVDLWSAALAHPAIAATERALYDDYRCQLDAHLAAAAPAAPPGRRAALGDTIMATLDGLWLDCLRRGDRAAVENGLATTMAMVRVLAGA